MWPRTTQQIVAAEQLDAILRLLGGCLYAPDIDLQQIATLGLSKLAPSAAGVLDVDMVQNDDGMTVDAEPDDAAATFGSATAHTVLDGYDVESLLADLAFRYTSPQSAEELKAQPKAVATTHKAVMASMLGCFELLAADAVATLCNTVVDPTRRGGRWGVRSPAAAPRSREAAARLLRVATDLLDAPTLCCLRFLTSLVGRARTPPTLHAASMPRSSTCRLSTGSTSRLNASPTGSGWMSSHSRRRDRPSSKEEPERKSFMCMHARAKRLEPLDVRCQSNVAGANIVSPPHSFSDARFLPEHTTRTTSPKNAGPAVPGRRCVHRGPGRADCDVVEDQPLQSRAASEAFQNADASGDGRIDRKEFREPLGVNASQAELDKLFAQVDKDGDGELDPRRGPQGKWIALSYPNLTTHGGGQM